MKRQLSKNLSTLVAAAAAAALVAPLANAKDHKDHERTATTIRSLEGMDLNGKDNTELGVVRDVIFSSETGKIDSLVIGTGFLGLGGPDREIDMQDIEKRRLSPGDLRTKLTEAEVNEAKRFSESELMRAHDNKADLTTGEMLAYDLIGADFEDMDGVRHGTVHDWIVDVNNANIPFVIIQQRDPVDITQQDYFAVRTDALRGLNEGDLVGAVDSGDFTDASRIDSEKSLMRIDSDSVRQFRYEPTGIASSM